MSSYTAQVREDSYFDTVEYASSTVSTGDVEVFRDLTNKNKQSTNLSTQRKISTDATLALSQVGVHVRQAVGNRIATLPDMLKLYDNLVLTLKLNSDLVAQGPLVFGYQSGYGVVGISTETSFSTGTLGVASRAAAERLSRVHEVDGNTELNCQLTLFTASWHATDGSYAAPVLAQYNDVSVILHGVVGLRVGGAPAMQ